MELKIVRTSQFVPMPKYHTKGASCFDLHAFIEDSIWVDTHPVKIPTGLRVQIPEGYEGIIRPRSGLSLQGLNVVLGTIDSDYRGEISIVAYCHGVARPVKPLERIAQMAIQPVVRVSFNDVQELDSTDRGEGGFGSTGK